MKKRLVVNSIFVLVFIAVVTECKDVESMATPESTVENHHERGTAKRVSADTIINVGTFGDVYLYNTKVEQSNVVIFVSGDGGWNEGYLPIVQKLKLMNTMVAGIDNIQYLYRLQNRNERCIYPAGDIEELSKSIQKIIHYTTYKVPILCGYSSGASIVYISMAQSSKVSFKAGISLAFCQDLPIQKKLCPGSGLVSQSDSLNVIVYPDTALSIPWKIIIGDTDHICSSAQSMNFAKKTKNTEMIIVKNSGHALLSNTTAQDKIVDEYKKLISIPEPYESKVPAQLSPELPLVIVMHTGDENKDLFCIQWSGDGGWGVTDQGISKAIAQKGVPVAGVNSLKYFWKKKTPEEGARDLASVAQYYSNVWNRNKIILIGYSFGADILSFFYNRLPQNIKDKISLIVLISPSRDAEFQFHFSNWIGGSSKNALPVMPEIMKIKDKKIICFYGDNDKGSLGPELSKIAHCYPLKTGHRIGKNFEPIANILISLLKDE